MTTYGTIPTDSNPPSSSTNLEFVSRAKERLRSGLAQRRPWSEVFSLRSLSLPPKSFNESLLRIGTNFSYFLPNYAVVVLFILFLSLLWHPVSLIVFIATMAAWLFLYFLRDEPLVVAGRLLDDRIVLAVLAVFTLIFLFLTDVTVNIVVALVVGVVVVVAHAATRRTDDLPADEFDEEASIRVGAGPAKRPHGARMPLKDTASSSFSTR